MTAAIDLTEREIDAPATRRTSALKRRLGTRTAKQWLLALMLIAL
jgi:hypothetical protein